MCDRVSACYIVERESDRRLGILVYLQDSLSRYVFHRDDKGHLYHLAVEHISNRWKVVSMTVGTLEAMVSKRMSDVQQYLQSDRIWTSCAREYESRQADVERHSMNPLGRLLEDLVFSSQSLKDCLNKFGKDSSTGDGMLTFIVMQIPLVGGTFYTAMEFYGLRQMLKSRYVSRNDKVDEAFKKVFKVGFTFGTVLSTSMIGQLVIPIPILGALIGGAVGGVFSTIVGKSIDRSNSNPTMAYSIFIRIVMKCRLPDGSWSFDNLQGIKHILARYFILTKSNKFADNLWLTIICFVNVSVYHTLLSNSDRRLVTDEEQLESMNQHLEPTIAYLSERIDLLSEECNLSKISAKLSQLCSEGYIGLDIETKTARK